MVELRGGFTFADVTLSYSGGDTLATLITGDTMLFLGSTLTGADFV